jgi:amidase
VVEQVLAAGATITGKTICDEFFYNIAGVNAHYGTPTNLRASGRPGGSSGGSAAACGANACDFALGSDTGGSIRIPASLNGL